MYPAQMEYDPSRTENPQHLSHRVSEMTRYSSKCCKTGGYKDACLTPEQKKAVYKYHTCANPSEFDATKKSIFDGRSCSNEDLQSCRHTVYAEGMCYDPRNDPQGYPTTQEDCSKNPDRDLRPFSHADRVFNAWRYKANADSCCLDKQVSEGCNTDIVKDSFLQTPPSSVPLCHDMSRFNSNLQFPGNTMTCETYSLYSLYAHIFMKGECVNPTMSAVMMLDAESAKPYAKARVLRTDHLLSR